MSTSRYFDRICAVVLAFTLIVTVLFMNGQSFGIELMVDADSEAHSDNEYFTENDEISDWDTASATYISLDGDSITVSGNNAYEYEGNLVIAGSGKFVVSGTLDDGYITVDANANSKVWILLDGVDISCSDNACLRVDEADKVFLTLAEGTANTLSGGGELSDEALEDGSYGVIFAHDDLTINGSGSLRINAGYKHGIKANDDLVITGGTITIDAPADGIHVNDSFRLKEASVSITAGDDGILTENEESYFYLESGNITLSAEGDGIHSNGDVMIAGGTITMDAGDDGIHADGDVEIEDGLIAMNSCYEGIEGASITVSGGDITIYSTDDGFNASSGSSSEDGMFQNRGGNPGNMRLSENGMQPPEGTEFTPENGMQPPEGTEFTPENGMQPPEGMEIPEGSGDTPGEQAETDPAAITENGSIPEQSGKSGNEQAAAGGSGAKQQMTGEFADRQQETGESDNAADSGNTQEDTENYIRISGGTVIACGSSSMAEGFASSSTQCSILYNISSGMDAGTYLAVKDDAGTEILSWELPCSFSSALVSSPDMQIGETYTVSAGENEETVSLSEISASLGDARSMMAAGNMNRGGMHGRR